MPSSASRMRSSRRRRRREARRGEGREKERGGGERRKRRKTRRGGTPCRERCRQMPSMRQYTYPHACMHARIHLHALLDHTHTNNTHIYTHTHMRVRAGRVVSVSPRLKTRAHAAWEKKKDAVLAFLPPALSVSLSFSHIHSFLSLCRRCPRG